MPDLDQTPRTTDSPTGSPWWTLVAVATGVFMLLLDITIVNVALPNIQTELHASLSDLQWVIDAYALSLAALLLTAGSLADLYGRRLVVELWERLREERAFDSEADLIEQIGRDVEAARGAVRPV